MSVCLKIVSLCVRPHQQTASFPSHLKLSNYLKLKHLDQHHAPSTPNFDRSTQTNILSKYFAVYLPFLLMWASDIAPTLCIIRYFAFRLLEPSYLATSEPLPSTPHFVH